MTQTLHMEFNPPRSGQDGPVEWSATMPDASMAMATQIMAREGDDPRVLGAQEIGRPVGPNLRELFVSCDAAEALRQQFTHLESAHIALHDVGGYASRQLLRQLAAAGGTPVHKLVVRQQGYGTTLASLEYASFTPPGGRPVHIYSTDVQTTPSAQAAVTRVLMELSQASIVLLTELPGQGSGNALRTMMQMVHQGSWTCPNLLVLPLGPSAASAAAAQSSQVVQRHGMLVRAAPQPARPADAWSYILGFWQKNANRGRLAVTAATAPHVTPFTLQLTPEADPAEAPAEPAALASPWPAPRAAAPVPDAAAAPAASVPSAQLEAYVGLVSQMTGLLSCCVFDINQGKPYAHAGRGPSPVDMARQGSAILRALQMARLALNLAEPAQEMLTSSDRHHQVVRPLPGHPDIALHCLLDRHKTNQSLVRFQLQRLDAWLKQQAR